MNLPPKQVKKQRLELILLFALPIVGILLMTAYYFYVVNNQPELGTHNKGILVDPPKPASELSLTSQAKPFLFNDDSGKWTFVVVGGASCDEACVEKLYLTRQIREALGKHKLRVRNVYLATAEADAQLSALLNPETGEYKGHTAVFVEPAAFNIWANQAAPKLDSLQDVSFYVVDPAGWFMMYYQSEHNYKQVISDMKFLIKNS